MAEEGLGLVHFDDLAGIHQHQAIRDLTREPHFMADHHHGHAIEREANDGVEHLLDHLRIERGGRLVEQHDLWLHAQGPRDGDPLLLAARELSWIFVRLLRDAHPLQIVPGNLVGFLSRQLADPDGRKRAVLEHRQMGKQVELLKHHADFAADLIDLLEVLRQFHAVDDDPAALPVLDAVDASKQRRLAAARRAADDDALASHDLEIDTAQNVEGTEPLVQVGNLDGDFVFGRAHFERDMPGRSVRTGALTSVAQVLNPVSARPLGV